MSPTTSEIHDKLIELIKKLQEHKAEPEYVEKCTQAIEMAVRSMKPAIDGEQKLLSELKKMLDFIKKAKQDLAAIGQHANDAEHLSVASEELEEVVKATEEAANRIMDAADVIMEKAGSIEGDASTEISNQVAEIFDACNFQDLTGQRIRKVMQVIEYLEERLSNLTSTVEGAASDTDALLKSRDKRADADLMGGPAKSGDAPSQDDIDKLFNSLD